VVGTSGHAITGISALRGRLKPLSVAEVKRLKEEHASSVVPLQTLAGEALTLEERVSDLVNAAYWLTPDEIKLMWDTAPPRMPLAVPGELRQVRPVHPDVFSGQR
jgi:hypothetical protein